MNKTLLALKPYLDSVKKRCSRLSNDELTEIILGQAKEVPAKQRIAFLETIDRLSQKQPVVPLDDEILSMIEALKGDIRKRAASIENGSYNDDHYEEHRSWVYHDMPPDTLSEDQKDQLEAYFEEAAQLFLSGQLEEARKVYASLFELVDGSCEEDEEDSFYGSDYSLEVEMRETRARYCRCVYETTALSKRVPAMLAVMNLHARLNKFRFDVYENNHPMFCDVMDSRPGELAERDLFLSRWRDALSGQSSDRVEMLLLEAVYLLEGLDAVQSLVRTWGGRQPRAWLFWNRLLVLENDWQDVAAVAKEALPMVAHGAHREFRALIAEQPRGGG